MDSLHVPHSMAKAVALSPAAARSAASGGPGRRRSEPKEQRREPGRRAAPTPRRRPRPGWSQARRPCVVPSASGSASGSWCNEQPKVTGTFLCGSRAVLLRPSSPRVRCPATRTPPSSARTRKWPRAHPPLLEPASGRPASRTQTRRPAKRCKTRIPIGHMVVECKWVRMVVPRRPDGWSGRSHDSGFDAAGRLAGRLVAATACGAACSSSRSWPATGRQDPCSTRRARATAERGRPVRTVSQGRWQKAHAAAAQQTGLACVLSLGAPLLDVPEQHGKGHVWIATHNRLVTHSGVAAAAAACGQLTCRPTLSIYGRLSALLSAPPLEEVEVECPLDSNAEPSRLHSRPEMVWLGQQGGWREVCVCVCVCVCVNILRAWVGIACGDGSWYDHDAASRTTALPALRKAIAGYRHSTQKRREAPF